MGPGPGAGTNDAGGSICGVARLAAISQQGARGKGATVSLGLVQQVSVLDARGPRTA